MSTPTKTTPLLRPAIYQMQVSIEGISPPIWRQFQVSDDMSLYQLHEVLQIVMGWLNYHLYQFTVNGRLYGEPDDEYPGPHVYQAKRARLRTVADDLGDSFTYEYDFGDGWKHHLVVEDVVDPEPGVRYPRCLAGSRACPPEDCGGVYGYRELLEILHDPDHEEYEGMRIWAGEDFDPEAFDFDIVNAALWVMVGKRPQS